MQYKELAKGRWFELSFVEQMSNVGSEVIRVISRNKKDNLEYSKNSIDCDLKLLYLTIEILNIIKNKNFLWLKEFTQVYETLVDNFYYDNIYGSSSDLWYKFFLYLIV